MNNSITPVSIDQVLAFAPTLVDQSTGKVDKSKLEQLVNKLSPEQLQNIVPIAQEQARRFREEKLRYFKPQEQQLPFLISQALTRIIHGGNRSGKTEVIIAEVIYWATGTHPYRDTPIPPLRIRVCGASWPHIGRVVLRKFKQLCPREYLRGGSWERGFTKNLADMEEPATLTFANGSIVQFMTYEQRPEKFSGDDLDLVVEDEEPTEAIHVENIMRLTDRNGSMIVAFTPDNGITWIYEQEIVPILEGDIGRFSDGRPKAELFQFLTELNPYVSTEAIEERKRKFASDPELLAIKTRGEFVNLGGAIFRTLRPDVHVVDDFEIDHAFPLWPRCVAIDPAPSKSHAALWCALDPRRESMIEGKHPVYVYRELQFDAGLRISDFCDQVKRLSRGQYISFWPIDPHWDWTNKAGEVELNIYREFANHLPVYPGGENKNEIYYELIKDRLLWDKLTFKSGLYIFGGACPKLVKQMKALARVRPRDPQKMSTDDMPVRKVNDDLIDCLGLALSDAFAYDLGGFDTPPKCEYVTDPTTGRITG